MREKAEAMRAKLQDNLKDLKKLEPFSQSSNLIWRKQKIGEDQLFLNIFNPYYHERIKEENRYLVSYQRFEEEVREQSQGKKVFMEMVVNMGGVNRVILSTEDLCVIEDSDNKSIKQALLNLGELRIFEKVKKIFDQPAAEKVTLFGIPNKVSIKILTSDSLKTNVHSKSSYFVLLVAAPDPSEPYSTTSCGSA